MCSEAEDAGGLTPGKDDNEVARYFLRRTLLILRCVDYKREEPNPGPSLSRVKQFSGRKHLRCRRSGPDNLRTVRAG